MPAKLIDISVPVRAGTVVYEGDPPVRLALTAAIARGDVANVSRIDFGLHTGTHIDAPVHFIEGAGGIETIDVDALVGRALVVDATRLNGHIDAGILETLDIPDGAERLIFKTANSRLWDRKTFSDAFIALTEDAAGALVRRGVRLIGIDYLSIAPGDDPRPTHVTLLEAGVVILEGLDLRSVSPGAYELLCLPLLIPGADGAPARAMLSTLA